MNAIFKREWHSYFLSPIGYIFSGVFIALCSFFFVNGALMYQSADIKVIFSNINIIYLFLVSMITMGLFSAERSRRTDQLLLTSPVSVGKIVIAKYCAALWVFGITLILSMIYPLIFRLFGAPPMNEIIGAYIGFLLLWASLIAIGTLISSMTENQIVSAIVTFGVLLIVFYMSALSENITNPALRTVVRWFSLMDRYSEFQSGILNMVNVVYYISFIITLLFLTTQVIHRRQISDRKLHLSNLVVTVTVITSVILVNANVSTIAAKIPMKIDLTDNDVYEYAEQTKEVLAGVDEEVNVYAFYPASLNGETVATIREYLAQYKQMNHNINVIYKDPYEDPVFVRQYGDELALGSVVVAQGERFRVIPFEKLYRENQYSGSASIDAENQFTSAIQYVTGMGQVVKAYFIKGHNEYAGDQSALATELENEGYTVGEITIATDGIPEDADLLVSLAPEVDFTSEERDALDAYLLGDGKAAFAFTAGTQPMERLHSYLAEWGITINNDFVVENNSSMAFRSQMGVPVPAPQIMEHSTTQKLISGDVSLIAPASCSLSINENNPQYASVTTLLRTSKDSWGETQLTAAMLEKNEGDISGPLTVAAIAEKHEGGKIFVIGSLQAIEAQGLLNDSSYCNGDFVLNVFSYLTDKGDALNIRAKIISTEALTMTEQQIRITAILVQYVLPLLILAAGLIVWLRRRYL